MGYLQFLKVWKHRCLAIIVHERYQHILSETPSWSVNPPGTCLFEACLSPKPKFRAIKSFAQISLTVRLACAVHSFKQIPHHGNFHHHRVIAASERLRLPDPWNLGGTSFHKSLPVHGDRCVFPQTPDSRYRDLRRSRNNDDETTDRPLSLLVRRGPPQGMRTLRIDRTDGRNVVEDTAARGATQGGAGRTRKHTTINLGHN